MDTLAAFVQPGMMIETPLWDAANQRRSRAVVESISPMDGRLRIVYRYPSGYESYQMLRPHDPVPLPDD